MNYKVKKDNKNENDPYDFFKFEGPVNNDDNKKNPKKNKNKKKKFNYLKREFFVFLPKVKKFGYLNNVDLKKKKKNRSVR